MDCHPFFPCFPHAPCSTAPWHSVQLPVVLWPLAVTKAMKTPQQMEANGGYVPCLEQYFLLLGPAQGGGSS